MQPPLIGEPHSFWQFVCIKIVIIVGVVQEYVLELMNGAGVFENDQHATSQVSTPMPSTEHQARELPRTHPQTSYFPFTHCFACARGT
jgi:hypothetical protein